MADPKYFANAAAFRRWLEANAATALELIVGFRKVGSGRPGMTWPESVDEALCFGWIDGVRKRIDDRSYQIRFTPRKPGSIWSAVNIAKVAKLSGEGRMTSAGTEAFARREGRRSVVYAYEQVGVAELSPEEIRVFKRARAAWLYFAGTPPGYRKTVLHWVASARKAETRARRFGKLLEACAAGARL